MAQTLNSTLDQSPTGHARGESVGQIESDPKSPLQCWLEWQCKMIDGVTHASLFTVKIEAGQVFAEDGQAHWPTLNQAGLQQLLVHANTAVQKRATLVNKMPPIADSERQFECISIPLPFANPLFVLTLLIAPRQPLRHRDLAKLIEWGSHWLLAGKLPDPHQLQQKTGQTIDTRSIVAACTASQSMLEANFELVGSIASALLCDRVSIGFLTGQKIVLQAISGLPQFDQRMQLVRGLEQVMEEALKQGSVVDSANSSAVLINHQHRDFAARQTVYCISVPLIDESGSVGVITLERSVSGLCEHDEILWLENLSTLITPVLRLRQLSEQSIVAQFRSSLESSISTNFSAPFDLRGRSKLVVTICALMMLAATFFFNGEYRITTNATIEGADKQVVVAPFPGFILTAGVRAGDEVEAEQVLASLDISSLQVEKEKWLSELSKLDKSYAHSLATGNRVELSLAKALRTELSAELELVDQRIARSQVKAPFRGVVVSGDLNQLLGAPVEQGQVLFEIASMDEFRLMLDIDEQSIADVQEGQDGLVRLASMPGITHKAVLKSLQPVAVMVDGKNVFRMEAELHGAAEQFRPGMQGVAKISAGERSLFWLWTHKLTNRVRLWMWYAGF